MKIKINTSKPAATYGFASSIAQFVDRYYKPPKASYINEKIYRREMLNSCKKEYKEKGECIIPAESSAVGYAVKFHKNLGLWHKWALIKLQNFVDRSHARREIEAQKRLIGFVDTHQWEKVTHCDICHQKYGYSKIGPTKRQKYRCKNCGHIFSHDLSESFEKSLVKNGGAYFVTCKYNQNEQECYHLPRQDAVCSNCSDEYYKKFKIKHEEWYSQKSKYEKFMDKLSKDFSDFKHWVSVYLRF